MLSKVIPFNAELMINVAMSAPTPVVNSTLIASKKMSVPEVNVISVAPVNLTLAPDEVNSTSETADRLIFAPEFKAISEAASVVINIGATVPEVDIEIGAPRPAPVVSNETCPFTLDKLIGELIVVNVIGAVPKEEATVDKAIGPPSTVSVVLRNTCPVPLDIPIGISTVVKEGVVTSKFGILTTSEPEPIVIPSTPDVIVNVLGDAPVVN